MRLTYDTQKKRMNNLRQFLTDMESHLDTIEPIASEKIINNVKNAISAISICICDLNKCRIV